jgi:hypothetical protein
MTAMRMGDMAIKTSAVRLINAMQKAAHVLC